MKILVIAAHTDDFIYGAAGTLLVHQEDQRHLVVIAPTQRTASDEVVRKLGVTPHVLDGDYRRIEGSIERLQASLVEILGDVMPDYVLAPPATGDWSPDHSATGRLAIAACVESGVFSSWNARLLRYPIPATTVEFRPNVWIDLPPELLEEKRALALLMTRGAEDIWPPDVVDWEVRYGHRFAQEVGWPATHVEAFDCLQRVPFRRLPPRDDSRAAMHDVHRRKLARLMDGGDLSVGEGAQP